MEELKKELKNHSTFSDNFICFQDENFLDIRSIESLNGYIVECIKDGYVLSGYSIIIKLSNFQGANAWLKLLLRARLNC